MTKRIVRLAVLLGAAAALSAPGLAQASQAPCTDAGTFIVQCVEDTANGALSKVCVDVGTFPVCLPPVSS
jgi:hypothetical protein